MFAVEVDITQSSANIYCIVYVGIQSKYIRRYPPQLLWLVCVYIYNIILWYRTIAHETTQHLGMAAKRSDIQHKFVCYKIHIAHSNSNSPAFVIRPKLWNVFLFYRSHSVPVADILHNSDFSTQTVRRTIGMDSSGTIAEQCRAWATQRRLKHTSFCMSCVCVFLFLYINITSESLSTSHIASYIYNVRSFNYLAAYPSL